MDLWKYSEKVKVDMYDVDPWGDLRISRLTERLLVAASRHLERLDWSWTHLAKDLGVCLVLVESAVQTDKNARLGDELTVTTWTGGKVYPIMFRGFEVRDSGGEKVASSFMRCVLMDMNTRTITNALKYNLTPLSQPDDMPDFAGLSARLRGFRRTSAGDAGTSFFTAREAYYADLDYNGHVNTARYAEYVEGLFPKEWRDRYVLTGMDVRYEKEIPQGMPLVIKGIDVRDAGVVEVTAEGDGQERFAARAYYSERKSVYSGPGGR